MELRINIIVTPREKDVIDLIVEGLSNKQIANRLNIVDQTVKNHVTSLFRKFNAASRMQLLLAVVKNGSTAELKRTYVYVICPVRAETSESALQHVKQLEKMGYIVFYPPRDVEQQDTTGYKIIDVERRAIIRANEIHVFYSAYSQGSHFDLGMTFALNKRIRVIEILRADDERYPKQEKSYLNALDELEKYQSEQEWGE